MALKKSVKKALLFVGSLMVACSVLLGDVVEVRADQNPKIGHHVTVSRINENDEVEVFEEYKNSAVAIYRLKDSQNICDASFERLGVSDLDLSIGKTAKPTGMGNNGKNVETLTLGEGTLICIYYKNQKDDYSLVNHFGIDKTSNSSRNYYITTYMSESNSTFNSKNWHWLLSNGNESDKFFFVIEIGEGEDEEPIVPPTEEEGEPEKIPEENEEPEEVPEEEEVPVEEDVPVEDEPEEEPPVEEEVPPVEEEEEPPVEGEPEDEQPENTDNQDNVSTDEPESTPAEQPESTPAEQPESTPSEQPAAEPASQPTEEPASQPEVPAAQPAAQPAPQIVVIAENPVPEVAIIEEVEASEPEEIEIVEEIVPLAPVVSKEEENVIAEEPEAVIDIPEEEVPMAVSTHCIIHWIVICVALIYALYSSMRVIQNKQELTDEVETENNL